MVLQDTNPTQSSSANLEGSSAKLSVKVICIVVYCSLEMHHFIYLKLKLFMTCYTQVAQDDVDPDNMTYQVCLSIPVFSIPRHIQSYLRTHTYVCI